MKEAPPLGDSHNFGRRVSVRGDRVHKPRTLAWEHLLLGTDSPLRDLLAEAARKDGLGADEFEFLPRLRFFPSPSEPGGEVERVQLDPLPDLSAEGRSALAAIVGRSLSLFSWLGVADLHWENLVLGKDAHGRIVFGPLDVEMILADLPLPTHTKLLPDADPEVAEICRHAAGVRRVLPFLGKPIACADLLAMAGAYLGTLGFLNRHGPEIASLLGSLPGLREAPIRVCLRGTDEYVRARRTKKARGAPYEEGAPPLWPPLLEAEAEQLDRGDIPYFFRLYGQPGIHYYADRDLRQIARLPLTGDVPQLEPLLSIARDLRGKSRKRLREEGLLTVLGAFDHPSFTGSHAHVVGAAAPGGVGTGAPGGRARDGLVVTFQKRTLVVKLPGGEELVSRRDMRAFVGSVYLPCRCGEVRTVFVPQVTKCEERGD